MPALPLVIAHAGHWAIYALYAIPFIVVGFSIVATTLRERREARGVDKADDA
jgi:hypothetical protein